MKRKIFLTLLIGFNVFNTSVVAVNAPNECIEQSIEIIQAIEEKPIVKEIWPVTVDVSLPTNEKLCNKTYMDYRKITNRDTAQWKYIHSDEITVNDKGFLVTQDGYIGVALGTYFGEVGSKYIFELDTGKEIKVVKVEVKSDKHTCKNNYKAGSDDVIEFVIDTKANYMRENVWGNGYIFQGNFNNCEDFKGNIIGIKEVL